MITMELLQGGGGETFVKAMHTLATNIQQEEKYQKTWQNQQSSQ